MHPRAWIKWRTSSWTSSQAYGPMANKISQEPNKQRKNCCERQARKQRGRLWFRNSRQVLFHRRRVLNSVIKIKIWGARTFVHFKYRVIRFSFTDFGCNKTAVKLYLLLALVCSYSAGCEKFARVHGLWLHIVDIKLQLSFSCCYQLSPNIICHYFAWKDNLLTAYKGGKKLYKSREYTCDSKQVAAAA